MSCLACRRGSDDVFATSCPFSIVALCLPPLSTPIYCPPLATCINHHTVRDTNKRVLLYFPELVGHRGWRVANHGGGRRDDGHRRQPLLLVHKGHHRQQQTGEKRFWRRSHLVGTTQDKTSQILLELKQARACAMRCFGVSFAGFFL